MTKVKVLELVGEPEVIKFKNGGEGTQIKFLGTWTDDQGEKKDVIATFMKDVKPGMDLEGDLEKKYGNWQLRAEKKPWTPRGGGVDPFKQAKAEAPGQALLAAAYMLPNVKDEKKASIVELATANLRWINEKIDLAKMESDSTADAKKEGDTGTAPTDEIKPEDIPF